MDTESLEAQQLAEAKKQTGALESLRTIAVIWSFLAVLGLVIWLIASIASGS